MIRAFIVKIDVQDTTLLADTAADIDDDLTAKGHIVKSVAPWKGHGLVTEPKPVQPIAPPPIL